MRTAGLSLLTALTALHAITVSGIVTCNTESILPATSATSVSGLQDRLSSIVLALCHTPSEELGTVSKHSEGFVLELRRGKAEQDANECQVAFAAIISHCIRTGKASGSESHAEKDITYLVYASSPDDHHSNHVRAPGPVKPAPSKPRPAKPLPAKPAPAKARPAKPAPAKARPAPAKPLPASVPAKTVKIGPTKNCKQLALLMRTRTKKGKLARNIEEDRGEFVSSRVDIKIREELAKRAPEDDGDAEWDGPDEKATKINHEGSAKKGSACGITFDALNYPKAASMAFPGVKNREHEFVWLQATMNTPAKSNMWAFKGSKDDKGTLHNAEKMRQFITGEKSIVKGQKVEKVSADLVDKANIALLKLKALMGARKYMRSKTVSDIFKDQKEEIGKMLTAIDNELPNNPRKPLKGLKEIDSWVKQNLGDRWFEYMDERFAIAHKRTHNDMDTYLELLDDKWCGGRPKSKPGSPARSRPGTPTADKTDTVIQLLAGISLNSKDPEIEKLCQFLDKMQKEWTVEKAIPWTAPW
ncbi:hypothetical protein N0V94_002936 [Neodidymelliopsis sp. IMI 364377]|nr:hypothetical protein N0V94_002936 [Neodidymelliopsis sp. IMI 364377]